MAHGAVIRHLDRALGLQPHGVSNLEGRWYDADGHGALAPGEVVTLTDAQEHAVLPSVEST